MPKRHQQRMAKAIRGRNNPKKSTVIVTGPPKKQEAYQEQAREHDDPGRVAQAAQVPTSRDWQLNPTHEADSQRRMEDRETRSGSDSNAHKHRKGNTIQDNDKVDKQPHPQPEGYGVNHDYAHDLAAAHRPAEDMGLGASHVTGEDFSAYDIKELHNKLADLTDNELKNVVIVPTGTRLEQGSKYIDLSHLEQGEFVATGDMVAEPGHYYVPKNEVDYVLWNRLNQVDNPARLDEAGE